MPKVSVIEPSLKVNDNHYPTLIFCRAQGEAICLIEDVISLLENEGIATGAIRARNPMTHDQSWISLLGIAKAGVPYAIALGAVIRHWLKERTGRRVKLEKGSLKIHASSAADVESMLGMLVKYERKLGSLHITSAQSEPKAMVKKAKKKKSDK
jgi:hypothetical protein